MDLRLHLPHGTQTTHGSRMTHAIHPHRRPAAKSTSGWSLNPSGLTANTPERPRKLGDHA